MNAHQPEIKRSKLGKQQRRQQLDRYYVQVQLMILTRQDPVTGLLPASTGVTLHDHYAHIPIRDNVYSILAVWGLALAYRHHDRDDGKRYLLEQSVVKLMRGLLMTTMRQTIQVECFKSAQNSLQVLPVKYDCPIGDPLLGDDPWRNLQPDAIALFLLMLAQMIASGLRIVLTLDEVDFIQNLVHCLGRAYYTPDYGLWEQGHKYQEAPEIHASSIGMVKAALEVLQGFDLFGAHGGPASVIHVVADDIAHIRNILETLLPRASNSKETDAALLAVIGFPAFAVENAGLVERSRHEIIGKLQGRYGCKHFTNGSCPTASEDNTALHSSTGELSRAEHIESEWPLFFTYLFLDRTLCGDSEQAWHYRECLESLLIERHGQRWLSDGYSIPELGLERVHPHKRFPAQTVSLVWAQSLYLLGVLLQEGFIQPHELDPLGRRSRIGRYRDTCTLIALIAENETIQKQLQQQGIDTQTPEQVLPLRIYPACALEGVMSMVGHNHTLGLSGRSPGWLGSLTTAQVYLLAGGKTAVFTPSFLDFRGFYLTLDNHLLAERIKNELTYLARYWDQPGQPLMVLSINAAMWEAGDHDVLLALLRSLQSNRCPGIQVRTARLWELLPVAGWKRMAAFDFPVPPAETYLSNSGIKLDWEPLAIRPLTTAEIDAWRWEPDDRQLLQQLLNSRNPYEQSELLMLLWERLGPDFRIDERGYNLRQWLEAVYIQAGKIRLWGILRRVAGYLELVDATLQDAVAAIVMHGYSLGIGRAYGHETLITRLTSNIDIIARIRTYGGDDFRVRVLLQEIVLWLGMLIKDDPELFRGTTILRPWRLLLLMTAVIAGERRITQWEALDALLACSPSALLGHLRWIIGHGEETRRALSAVECLIYRGDVSDLQRIGFAVENELTLVGQDVWSAWREISGVPGRPPEDFHRLVGEILRHCRGLVIGHRLDGRNLLDSTLVQADRTRPENDFALRVEHLLNNIKIPPYRQLNIEALLTLADVFQANPGLYIENELVLDVLIEKAVYGFWREQQNSVIEENDHAFYSEAWDAFQACAPYRIASAIVIALSSLLRSADRKVKVTA